jgi:hypothetical protein
MTQPNPVEDNSNQDRGSQSEVDKRDASLLIRYLETFGSATAIGAALLFYFGWARAHAQADALGYDISLAGLSSYDYVLRSVPVLFLPVLVLLLTALALLTLHGPFLRWLRLNSRRKRASYLINSLRFAPLWLPILGLASLVVSPVGHYVALPVSITLGLLAFMYADRIRHTVAAPRDRSRVRATVIACLLVMLLFWDVERIARTFGESYADLIASRPEGFAQIVLFSAQDLEISQLGVVESMVGGDNSAYRFRYEGFRLLNYSNQKYFLLSPTPNGTQPVVVVVPDLPTIRVEFSGSSP